MNIRHSQCIEHLDNWLTGQFSKRGDAVDKTTVVDALCAGLKLPGVGDTVERAAMTRCVAAIYDHVPLFVWGIVISAADVSKQPSETAVTALRLHRRGDQH